MPSPPPVPLGQRPYSAQVDSSAAIESQFDGVAYSFGGSLLWSLRNFLNVARPGAYNQGLAIYLRR
jgi:hypothetical protein